MQPQDKYLRYRAMPCDISRDVVCQTYPGYLAVTCRDKDVAKHPNKLSQPAPDNIGKPCAYRFRFR